MRHVTHSSSIQINTPIDDALPFFTAKGERLWVAGWEPIYVYPESGAPGEGMIWKTIRDEHTEEVWVTVRYDIEAHLATYVKWSPKQTVTRVDIRCEPADYNTTQVYVTYNVTAVESNGDPIIKAFTTEAFEAMLATWESNLNQYLLQQPTQ